MSNNIPIGKYYSARSNIHRMNPISKILCFLCFVVMVFCPNTIQITVILSFLVGLMMLNTSIPFIIYLKTVKSLRFVLLFLLLLAVIFRLPVIWTILFLVRFILVIIYLTIITMTTPPTEITYGLEKVLILLKIFKLPVAKISLKITLAIRFVPNLIDESHRILKSQATRGIDYYHSNISGKITAVKGMIKPMFTIAYKKSKALENNMEVRLYNTGKKRTNFRINRWKFIDTYLFVIHIGIIVVIILKGVLG